MESIWKYTLKLEDKQEVKMPIEHEILDIQVQHGIATMWVKVDKTTKIRPFEIHLFGTGWDLPEDYTGDYLATVQDGSFVWHFFKDA